MRIKFIFFLSMLSIAVTLLMGGLNNAESSGTEPHKTSKTGKTSSQTDLISWRTLSDGRTEAKEKKMPILVDFYSEENCERCGALDKDVYSDSQLTEAISSNFIPVRVYKNKQMTIAEQALMDKLESGGECILAFLNSNGDIIRDQDGVQISTMEMIPPDKYTWFMDQALTHNN